MKIEGAEPKFKPFKIVIETEEEARFIYHKFLCFLTTTFKDHCRNNSLDYNKYANMDGELFKAIDKHVPKEVKK